MKKYKQYLKHLKMLPAAALGLCVFFFLLRRDSVKKPVVGINDQLPQAVNGHAILNKKLQYEAAERDSMRKAEFARQDPYRRDSSALKPLVRPDPKAEQVLEQLRQLQQRVAEPPAPVVGFTRPVLRPRVEPVLDTAGDARVGQLNSMLDKVIRIQHPSEAREKAALEVHSDEVVPADSTANTIAAVVADDQTLISGTTIALRMTDSVRVNGRVWPPGQLVYGTVAIANDRMLVHVSSLREERSLYVTDLQVYDLDGIAGIHIPGVLSRDVAKQSADQGVNSLNVLESDPSLGAQAANAGIQTVKAFAGRKVKQVRVDVRAGYQVLLREAHPKAAGKIASAAAGAAVVGLAVDVLPPLVAPDGPVITHCRTEGVRLRLRGLWLCEGRLWFGLEWENRSAIAYTPAYARWYIRDRRQVRRTAMQEVSLEPLSGGGPVAVGADSLAHSWTGFEPFAVARDKELVLEVAEKGGGRVLELVIKHQELLKAKTYVRETRDSAGQPGAGAL